MPKNAGQRYKEAHYARTEFLLAKEVKPKLVEYAKAHGFDSFSDLVCHCLEKETGIPCKLTNGLPWIDSNKWKADPKNS